ncbi:MAG: nucleotide sugar dehydrogenase [Thermoplasmata archaeon]
MKLCVLGLGYIGLPTAALFANRGFEVVGVDTDPERVARVNKGAFDISEPGLEAFLRDALNTGNLRATLRGEKADVFIICVPTPIDEEKKAVLSYVESAGKMISSVLKKKDLVILESTVPPGTTENVLLPILEESGLKAGEDFSLSHCPERVMPGKILKELTENRRIIGGIDELSCRRARELYSTFVEGDIHITNPTTAEFTKLAENTYRDVNIALANEFAKLCELHGTDVWTMRELANNHPRVDILKPGPGVGGHCLPVDPWFLVNGDKELIPKAREINEKMVEHVARMIINSTPKGGIVTILGSSYKANTEDERNSPTRYLVPLLEDLEVRVHDPYVRKQRGDVYQKVKDAHTVVLMVDHDAYKGAISFQKFLKKMAGKVLIDTRDFFDAEEWKDAGGEYVLLGA